MQDAVRKGGSDVLCDVKCKQVNIHKLCFVRY